MQPRIVPVLRNPHTHRLDREHSIRCTDSQLHEMLVGVDDENLDSGFYHDLNNAKRPNG